MSRARGITSRRASISVTPGFVLDIGVPSAAGAYSLRRLSSSYISNRAIRVQRISDSTQQDIGFDGSGNLDVSSLSTFCSGTTGYICKWYDQSGSGYDLIQATVANMYRIYSTGAVESQNGIPAARCPDSSRGMITSAFTAYAGTAVSACVVASITSGTSSFSPRYITLLPTGLSDTDQHGAQLLRRPGSSTPTEQWAINRANASPDQVIVGGNYGQLQQVNAVIAGNSFTLEVDGTGSSGTATEPAFSFTRIGTGYSGSAYLSSADEYISEIIIWFTALGTNQRSLVATNQSTFFGTAAAGQGTTPNYVLDDPSVPAPFAAFSTRRLTAAYAGPALQVRRVSDASVQDIGFDPTTHDLDVGSIATFCGPTGTGYVSKFYDQSGNGRDLSQSSNTNAYRIFGLQSDGSTYAVDKQNSRAALQSLDQVRGMGSITFSAYTGVAVSGSVVGVMSNQVTTSSPRYLSLIPSGSTDDQAGGAYLVARHGSSTPDQTWGTLRTSSFIETAMGTYGVLQLVTAVIADPSYAISVDGNNATTATAADGSFNFVQLGFGGFAGGSTYRSSASQFISEAIYWESALTTAQRTALEANQRAWFSTAAPSGGSGGGTSGAYQDVPTTGWNLVFEDNFTQGFSYTRTNSGGSTDSVTNGVDLSHWTPYGPPKKNTDGTYVKNGNEGVGYRWPHNVVTANGELNLNVRTAINECAGMSNTPGGSQKYGRWSVRFRQDKGVGAGPALLLWPSSGNWPNDGEIDICESPEGDCTKLHITCHIGSNNRQTGKTVLTDLSQFHVLTCIWTSAALTFYLDGTQVYQNSDLTFQPPGPMWIGIQNDEGASGHFIAAPTSSTPQPVTLHVDWVRRYQAA